MYSGNFYFIKDQYFIDFPDTRLMKNKEIINGRPHNRPCYYSFKDDATGIYWAVPISSQTPKYQKYHDDKLAKHGACYTIHFGYVLGERKAFLIQNMCPVIPSYINNQYLNANNGQPIILPSKLSSEIETKAKKALIMHRKGLGLIFPDVLAIETQLLAKLTPPTPIVTPTTPTTTP
ncbi:hypothetical protein EV210_12317 [Anaerospora hongkongensis]|uniref:Uncharacterized protein n=1 Tax=Anaerospora hongkongensis TaxID=244830 RepID=A0A4R1PWR1_9FIRM|nr:hypothetical protein [Anaerospora hongkongensis]TCL32197.1 hypothetical protein EV210_12317 [Anaerospora hongkongensis]